MANYRLDYQLAQMSNGVYGSPSGRVEGWTVVKEQSNPANGFAVAAYRNNTTGDVVIAYRGTNDTKDVIGADAKIALPAAAWDSQFKDALEFAKSIKEQYPNKAISVTGHSLGGGLAQVASQAYGFHGITFDPAGAENIVRSSQFKEWTQSNGLGANGKGVPSNFHNYLVAKSPISHQSGAHLGATSEISSLQGRNPLEAGISKATRLAGSPVGYGMDAKSSHGMGRIEGIFEEAARTGILAKPLPILGQAEDISKYANNSQSTSNPSSGLAGYKAEVVTKTTVAVNDLCDARGYPNHGGRDNMSCHLANDLITQGSQGIGTFQAALGVDGKTISVREQISEFKDFIASADSNVIVNIPKADSLAKIAAYEAPVLAQNNPTHEQEISRGRSL